MLLLLTFQYALRFWLKHCQSYYKALGDFRPQYELRGHRHQREETVAEAGLYLCKQPPTDGLLEHARSCLLPGGYLVMVIRIPHYGSVNQTLMDHMAHRWGFRCERPFESLNMLLAESSAMASYFRQYQALGSAQWHYLSGYSIGVYQVHQSLIQGETKRNTTNTNPRYPNITGIPGAEEDWAEPEPTWLYDDVEPQPDIDPDPTLDHNHQHRLDTDESPL